MMKMTLWALTLAFLAAIAPTTVHAASPADMAHLVAFVTTHKNTVRLDPDRPGNLLGYKDDQRVAYALALKLNVGAYETYEVLVATFPTGTPVVVSVIHHLFDEYDSRISPVSVGHVIMTDYNLDGISDTAVPTGFMAAHQPMTPNWQMTFDVIVGSVICDVRAEREVSCDSE